MTAKMKSSMVSPATKKATRPAPAPAASAAPVASVAPEAKPSAAPIAPASQPVEPVKTASSVAQTVTPAELQKMIECEAYLIAEKNNFQGEPADYWTQAEKLVSTPCLA